MVRKRAVERIPTNLNVQFIWSDKPVAGAVADLSENGMLLNTNPCPPLSAKFELSLPLEEEVLQIPVKVRRMVKKNHHFEAVGLEILNPPQKYLDFVSDLRWKQIRHLTTTAQTPKLYSCKMCQHIAFNNAPINCPVCSSTLEHFEKSPEVIKQPDNPAELSEFEKKHLPVITVLKEDGYVKAHITVGEVGHEMDVDDHISFIDFYYNSPFIHRKCVSRISFNCESIHPSTTVRLDSLNNGVLTAISNCTAHGSWLSKVTF